MNEQPTITPAQVDAFIEAFHGQDARKMDYRGAIKQGLLAAYAAARTHYTIGSPTRACGPNCPICEERKL